MHRLDARTEQQLAAIAEVDRLLGREGIEYWLFGGWAVDFHADSVTRRHDDVDLAVWLADLERISELLERHGWRHAPDKDEDGGTGFERAEVRLELTYLVRAEDGAAYTPLRQGCAPWSRDALTDDIRELLSIRSRGGSPGHATIPTMPPRIVRTSPSWVGLVSARSDAR